MMTDWENIELGNICEVVRGGSPRPIIDYITDEPDGVNWLKIGDVKETDKFFTHANEKIKPSGIPKTREVKAGDLILSNSMSFGRAFITLIDGYIHDGWLRLRCDESRLDKEYLYYFLTSNLAQNQFKAIATGSVVNNLKSDTVKAIKIDLPTLVEQKRIAEVLSMFDDKIKCNEEINKNLLEQAQAILTSFFIDFSQFGGTVPDDWKQGTLQDIANFSNGYAFKSKELLNTSEPNCYQVFKQGHIKRGGGFNSSGTKSWYPISKSSALSKYVLHKGDVLMAMTDMKDNVAILGNTALMAVDDQYIVNQRVGLLRSNGYKSTSYAYIYLLTNSLNFLKDLRSRANSGVQVNLSSSEIKDSSVWIANDEVNEEFNALTEPLLSMIMTNDIENQKLIDLRDTLLPKLMSGELDVSNLNL